MSSLELASELWERVPIYFDSLAEWQAPILPLGRCQSRWWWQTQLGSSCSACLRGEQIIKPCFGSFPSVLCWGCVAREGDGNCGSWATDKATLHCRETFKTSKNTLQRKLNTTVGPMWITAFLEEAYLTSTKALLRFKWHHVLSLQRNNCIFPSIFKQITWNNKVWFYVNHLLE